MLKILIIDDDALTRKGIRMLMPWASHNMEIVGEASNGKLALDFLHENEADLALVDLDMPVMNGFQMVERIRETDGDTPIVFASALTSPKDVREGYKIGVNNYIKKPFVPDELDAHIHGLLKMKEGTKTRNESGFYKIGRYTLDAEHASLRNDETNEKKILTVREAQILQLLAENKNETIKREAILSRFWNTEDDYFASRTLDVFTAKLRKLLEDDPLVLIKTIRGVGLMLVDK